jgi:hypothetical protein
MNYRRGNTQCVLQLQGSTCWVQIENLHLPAEVPSACPPQAGTQTGCGSSRCTACLPQAGILDSITICLENNKFVESGLFIRHASSLGGSAHPLGCILK